MLDENELYMNLNQITVPVLNVPVAIDFYKKLGLKLIVHTGDHYARFECTDGLATFSLHHVTTLPKGAGITVYFECDDLDEKVKELQDLGVVFEELPNDKKWLWREAHLLDPYGNHIILYYAGKNRRFPHWRLNHENS